MTGAGVPQEYTEAARWLREAAEQDHPAAQFNLGLLYETGQGVTQNYSGAFKWYRRAAANAVIPWRSSTSEFFTRPGRSWSRILRLAVGMVSRGGGTGVRAGAMQSWFVLSDRTRRRAKSTRGGEMVDPRRAPGRQDRAAQSRTLTTPRRKHRDIWNSLRQIKNRTALKSAREFRKFLPFDSLPPSIVFTGQIPAFGKRFCFSGDEQRGERRSAKPHRASGRALCRHKISQDNFCIRPFCRRRANR